MTLITRRDLLAGLSASGAASILPAQRQERSSAAASHTALLSGEKRRQHADALLRYFADNASLLLRGPDGILKQPSVAPSLPGKRYSTSLWDWDTLWTSRGLFRLAALQHDEPFKQKLCKHVSGSLLNFLDHQSEDGRIPMVLDVNNPDPLGSLHPAAPNPHNQAKPVMGQLALLIADEQQSAQWLASRFDRLLKFYDSWSLGNLASLGLLVWGDDVAIGDDNDPTTFGRPFFSSANLLLNCLFYQDLSASAELAQRLGRAADHDRLSRQAEELAHSIQKFCWDPRDKYYYTVDVQCADRRAELIPAVGQGMGMSWKCLSLRVQMFTGFLPLWCGIAPQQEAEELILTNYLADDRLCAQWGVRSLSNRETMYSLEFSSNPSNWLGPIWTIVNYFVWKALQRYGYKKEADALADKTISLLSKDLEANGSLNEYYHPDTGAALSHKGFMDWNLLVLEMI